MTKNSFRNIMIWICALVTIGMGVLIAQNYWSYAEAKTALTLKEQELKDVKNEINMIFAALERYEAEQKELEAYLFSDRDVPAFLDGIAEYGKQTGVNIFDMKTRRFQAVVLPDDVAGSKSTAQKRKAVRKKTNQPVDNRAQVQRILTLSAMPINIKVEGTFEGLVDFMGHLQSYRQLLSISKIEISTRGADYPALNCQFTLQIYSLKTLDELKNS